MGVAYRSTWTNTKDGRPEGGSTSATTHTANAEAVGWWKEDGVSNNGQATIHA